MWFKEWRAPNPPPGLLLLTQLCLTPSHPRSLFPQFICLLTHFRLPFLGSKKQTSILFVLGLFHLRNRPWFKDLIAGRLSPGSLREPSEGSWEVTQGWEERQRVFLWTSYSLWETGAESCMGILEDCVKLASGLYQWKSKEVSES